MNFCISFLGLTKHATILAHMFSIAENNGITVPLFDQAQVQNPAMTNEVTLHSIAPCNMSRNLLFRVACHGVTNLMLTAGEGFCVFLARLVLCIIG